MTEVLREITSVMEKPVVALLLLLLALTVYCIGALVCEYFTEHRHLKVSMPVLMEELHASGNDMQECLVNSGLLQRQKRILIELTKHPGFSDVTRDALAVTLLEEERERWYARVKRTDLLARLGPMLGLLGTLIPLGPGIQALGNGQTEILSVSLLTAFDTTVVGIICAAVALCISHVRRKWYARYMSVLEALAECILEVVKDEDK